MLQNSLQGAITLIILALVNAGLAKFTNASFIDYSAITGFAGMVLIHFLSTAGGISGRFTDKMVQGRTGIKVETTERTFIPSPAFITASLYFTAGLICTIIAYRTYFF